MYVGRWCHSDGEFRPIRLLISRVVVWPPMHNVVSENGGKRFGIAARASNIKSQQNVEQSYIQPQQTHSTIEVALQGSWNKTEE